VSALFLSGHSHGATQARGHEVGGPRRASLGINHMNSVGFLGSRGIVVNNPNNYFPLNSHEYRT
jgi:hypothetical protein